MSSVQRPMRDLLRKHYEFLVEELIVDYYINYLYQAYVLCNYDKSRLQRTRDQRKKSERFLGLMMCKPESCIQKFFIVLRTQKDKQPHVYNLLFGVKTPEQHTTAKMRTVHSKRTAPLRPSPLLSEHNAHDSLQVSHGEAQPKQAKDKSADEINSSKRLQVRGRKTALHEKVSNGLEESRVTVLEGEKRTRRELEHLPFQENKKKSPECLPKGSNPEVHGSTDAKRPTGSSLNREPYGSSSPDTSDDSMVSLASSHAHGKLNLQQSISIHQDAKSSITITTKLAAKTPQIGVRSGCTVTTKVHSKLQN